MSYTSLEGILNSVIEHQSVKHMFPYTITFVHPGGIRHGENALNMRRAMLFLDAHEGPITFDILKSLNISLVFNHVYLPTHHPEWIASGYRAESEVYYYPKCPRGYPVHKLHHFVFQGDENKIAKYDRLVTPDNEDDGPVPWFDLLEGGKISEADKKALFRIVSSKTHGTPAEFFNAWFTFLKMNPYGSVKPLLYAVALHDLIIQYMPFVNANRRLARLVMSNHLAKNGIYPPIFWSAAGYDSKICKTTVVELKEMEANGNTTAHLSKKRDFLTWVVALISEAECMYTQRPQSDARPYETWERFARSGKYSSAMYSYVKTTGRVLIPDVLTAISVFAAPLGKTTIAHPSEKAWIWNGCNEEFATAMSSLLSEGILKIVPAAREEYEVLRSVPEFNSSDTAESWRPSAIVLVA